MLTTSVTGSIWPRRLAAIVPPPRVHLARYLGVFAPRSALRRAVVSKQEQTAEALRPMTMAAPVRARRLRWSELLKRVFAVDVLRCEKCGGRRTVQAFLPGPALAQDVLRGLGINTQPLRVAKARGPPHQDCFDLPAEDPGIDPPSPD